jgi:hypothetical protein
MNDSTALHAVFAVARPVVEGRAELANHGR